jgi:hypothetical protein
MSPTGDAPLLALLSDVATRRVAALPRVAMPGGWLSIQDIAFAPEGLSVSLVGQGPLGLATGGVVHLRVTAVAADHAVLAVSADGGMAFRAAVGSAMAAGGVLEPLLRAVLGRPLRQGIELRGGQLRIHFAELVDGLPEAGS